MEPCLFFSVSTVQVFDAKYFHRLKIAHMSCGSVCVVVAVLLFTIICTQSTSHKLIITNCWRCRCRHPRRRRRRRRRPHYYCFRKFRRVYTMSNAILLLCTSATLQTNQVCVPVHAAQWTSQRKNIPSILAMSLMKQPNQTKTQPRETEKHKRRMFVFAIPCTLFHTIRKPIFRFFSIRRKIKPPTCLNAFILILSTNTHTPDLAMVKCSVVDGL